MVLKIKQCKCLLNKLCKDFSLIFLGLKSLLSNLQALLQKLTIQYIELILNFLQKNKLVI